jgi:hypothetical protein
LGIGEKVAVADGGYRDGRVVYAENPIVMNNEDQRMKSRARARVRHVTKYE